MCKIYYSNIVTLIRATLRAIFSVKVFGILLDFLARVIAIAFSAVEAPIDKRMLLLKFLYIVLSHFLFTVDMNPVVTVVAGNPVLSVHVSIDFSFVVNLFAIATELSISVPN